ncbi:MAG TPA: AbrB/MazE/SpoVT family DNA-binding domain-containing protein [Candidatus Eremiobacteraceae bacterium]|nr:AbrB/MazE/SpoVT family DNA-binding domain-containing protein [Candidatus Eremiobacteraceae bacterium]
MRAKIRRIGNSQGVILPKPIISQLDLGPEVEMDVEGDALVLRKARKNVRRGWAEAAKRLHELGEGKLIWPEFSNPGDDKLTW